MRDIKGVLIDLDGVVHEQFVWWGKKAGEDGEDALRPWHPVAWPVDQWAFGSTSARRFR